MVLAAIDSSLHVRTYPLAFYKINCKIIINLKSYLNIKLQHGNLASISRKLAGEMYIIESLFHE